ncbi:MAG: DUF6171 family protein [Mobilitalea sp.]
METNNKRICKKCFLTDFAPEEYLENMRIYLQGLSTEIKTEDSIYQRRLDCCAQCSNLTEGICKICGCFVEYRAAMKIKNCPDLHPRW